MKETTKEKLVLMLIFLIVLGSRLYFEFQTPYFKDNGYLNYRLVESISNSGKPLLYDELSYSGRSLVYSPVFHYILSFFSLFFNLDFVLKVFPSIFISLIVFVVYKLAFIMVNDKNLAMFVSLLSGFVPIVFVETLSNISVYTLVLPVVFYLIYLLIKIREGNNIKKFVFFSLFLGVLHPSSFVFVITLLFFIVLMVSDNIAMEKIKKEVIVFSILLILFIEFLIYKKAFLIHSFSIVRNNVPPGVLATYFNFSILETVLKVGVLVIIFGLISIALVLSKRREEVMLLNGLILSTILLLWFRLVKAEIGLMFLGIALVIISCISFKIFLKYFDKTRFTNYRNLVVMSSVLIFVLSLVLPSFIDASKDIKDNVPTDYEILVLDWIEENALPDVTVLAPLEKGHLITAISGKKNVIDDNFLLAPDASERFRDVETIYSTKSEVRALSLISKYNIDYILVPIETEIKFGKVKWLDDESCFEGIFVGTPKVYRVLCQ